VQSEQLPQAASDSGLPPEVLKALSQALPLEQFELPNNGKLKIVKNEVISTSFLPPTLLKQYPPQFQSQYLNDCHEMTQADIRLKIAGAEALKEKIQLLSAKQTTDEIVIEEQISSSKFMRWSNIIIVIFLIIGAGYFFYIGNNVAGGSFSGLLGAGFLAKFFQPIIDIWQKRK